MISRPKVNEFTASWFTRAIIVAALGYLVTTLDGIEDTLHSLDVRITVMETHH